MCSLSRYVVIGGFTGLAAATLSGSDLVGALVAAAAVGLTALALRQWPGLAGGCALPAASIDETDTERATASAVVSRPAGERAPRVPTGA